MRHTQAHIYTTSTVPMSKIVLSFNLTVCIGIFFYFAREKIQFALQLYEKFILLIRFSCLPLRGTRSSGTCVLCTTIFCVTMSSQAALVTYYIYRRALAPRFTRGNTREGHNHIRLSTNALFFLWEFKNSISKHGI